MAGPAFLLLTASAVVLPSLPDGAICMLKERCETRDVDRSELLAHLAQAEAHVATGEQLLARQRDLIARLERSGHDTTTAREVLAELERSQEIHQADRDRFLAELYSSD